jgi:NitT/TauT family transport system substrate-binding protein
MARSRRIAVGLSVLAVLALPACGGDDDEAGAAGSGGSGSVSYAVSTVAATLGQSYYTSIPMELGYWKDEGLDVKLTRFEGSGETATAVATGKVMVGSGGTLSNMAAHVNGGSDSKAFMSDIPGSVYYPMVPEDSDIRTLEDFEGKTLGVLSPSADGPQLLKGVMRLEGIDVDSIKFVAVGSGATVVEALKKGRIDAYQGYDSGYALLQTLGVKLRRIESPIDDLRFMSGVIAREDTIANDRETLVKLGRGIAKAMVFAKENPEAAVRIHWKVFPESKPSGVSDDEALEAGVTELQSRLVNVFPIEEQYGRIADGDVQRLIDVATASKFISKDLAVSDIWSSDLLGEINDFDVAQVKQQAGEYQPAQ